MLAACLAGAASVSSAQTFTQRIGKNEIYLLVNYWTSDDQTIPNATLPYPEPMSTTADIHLDFDDDVFWGFGYIYNFNPNLAVRAEMTFGWPDYKMDWSTVSGSGEAYVNSGKINLDYSFGRGAIRPFISAGIGYLYMDTGIPSGPPEFWIIWDYWWGYTLVATQNTYSETYFTYNAAAGVSWDINERTVMKLSFAANWMDAEHDTWTTTETTLSLGWRF